MLARVALESPKASRASSAPTVCGADREFAVWFSPLSDRREEACTGTANLGFHAVFNAYDRKVKISVDGKSCGSIIRPTSGAVETEKPLRFNELQRF